MAQNGISVSTDAIPEIAKLFGYDVSATQDAGDAGTDTLPASPGKSEVASSPNGDGKTKLNALQELLAGAGPQGAPPTLPPDNSVPLPAVGLNSGAMPPPDLAQSMTQTAPPRKATFAERHPAEVSALENLFNFVQDASAGAGARTFGEGAQAAARSAGQREQGDLATEKERLQIAQMRDTVPVRDPYGNVYQVPKAQLPKFLQTNITEAGKNSRNQASIDSRESIAGDKNAIALRKQGLKLDENGKQVPIPYEELSPAEQATVDLKQSQKDAADARTALDKAKNDPNSPAYKAAYGRLLIAQQNANTAAKKLGLDQMKYNADYLGLGPDNQALPGAPTDEATGKPIGPRVANAGAASADRLKRGDLAANAIHNLDNVAEIVNRRPELFGPVSGRLYTNTADMIGSNDPDIRAVGVEIHNYALASNGAHGVRSQQAIAKTEDEILKNFHAGPQGVLGGINAAKESLNDFVNDEKRGKRARPSTPTNGAPKTNTGSPGKNKIQFVPLS